jgi:hypothetical protein
MRQTSIHGARHSAESGVWRSSTAHLTWLSPKTVGDGEKLLAYFNSVLNVLLGTGIFPRVPKKKLNFVVQRNM